MLQAGLLNIEIPDKLFEKDGFVKGKVDEIELAQAEQLYGYIEGLKEKMK